MYVYAYSLVHCISLCSELDSLQIRAHVSRLNALNTTWRQEGTCGPKKQKSNWVCGWIVGRSEYRLLKDASTFQGGPTIIIHGPWDRSHTSVSRPSSWCVVGSGVPQPASLKHGTMEPKSTNSAGWFLSVSNHSWYSSNLYSQVAAASSSDE